MAQNDNQQQENRAFKKEDAYETLGIINTWIGNMDTKVSFALALAGVLIGVIFEKGMPSAFERIIEVSKLAELSGGEIIAVKDMDEKEMIDDLEEQIHTNSKICSLKAKWYNKGIRFLLVTVVLWFVCMIFQLL